MTRCATSTAAAAGSSPSCPAAAGKTPRSAPGSRTTSRHGKKPPGSAAGPASPTWCTRSARHPGHQRPGTASSGCTTAPGSCTTRPPAPGRSPQASRRSRRTWPPGCRRRGPGCAPPAPSTAPPRPRWPGRRPAGAVHGAARAALAGAHASRWVRYAITEHTTQTRKQTRRGRPGPGTTYQTITRKSFQISCDIDDEQAARDAASDGCWPLITNDTAMTGVQILAAYHYQPNLERRHHLLKGIQDAAPVWIKTITRIEAIFLCHFIALLICALIERQIRTAMKTARIASIPLYPELRSCTAPSADRIFEIFSHLTRHELRNADGTQIHVFEPQLTSLQQQILDLLGIPATAYTTSSQTDH